MAIGSSLTGISFGGLSSGIDTDSIISRLMQIEAIPLQRLQSRQEEIKTQQAVYGQFRTKLQAVSSAAGALNSASVFNPVSAASSDTSVATISASGDAIAGVYNLTVSKLAQAQKVASSAQADSTSALGKSGQFIVNGHSVQVDATDSLRAIAQKVNSTNSGVTASIIDGGAGSAYLTFTSNSSGAKNVVQAADLTGDSILGSLGMVSGAASLRDPITNGATSATFTKNNSPVGTMIGLNGSGASNFTINGTTVNVDLGNDNLQMIANSINTAVSGVTASVRSVTEGNTTTYKLDIVGAAGTPSVADTSGHALAALGITQQAFGNALVTAQDAEYKLDGVSLTSASNVITTSIPNVTLTLLKANATTPEKSTLSLSKDVSAIKGKVSAFKDAYNDAIDFIRTYSQFDKDSYASGPLFGDPVASQMEQQVSSMLFNDVSGLTGNYKNLTSIGFSLDDQGKLSIDDSILTNAVSSNSIDVANLFKTSGLGSNNDIVYVSSGAKSIASGSTAYDVNITALATKGSYTAVTAQTAASTEVETLTFSGSMFGTVDYALSINAGSNLSDTVSRINSDSKLKDLVLASIDSNGNLLVTSKKFGSGGNFTVKSNLASSIDNSGIGTSGAGIAVTGTNIQGTINGEEAIGNGQFLLGKAGNSKTDGLQIQYLGNSTGLVGSISLRKGIGTQASDMMGTFLDSVGGILTSADTSLKSQYEDLADQIADLTTRLQTKQVDLKTKFAAMEEAISNIQSQGQRLSALKTVT
jgi:flagellar hook-associated protein 2